MPQFGFNRFTLGFGTNQVAQAVKRGRNTLHTYPLLQHRRHFFGECTSGPRLCEGRHTFAFNVPSNAVDGDAILLAHLYPDQEGVVVELIPEAADRIRYVMDVKNK